MKVLSWNRSQIDSETCQRRLMSRSLRGARRAHLLGFLAGTLALGAPPALGGDDCSPSIVGQLGGQALDVTSDGLFGYVANAGGGLYTFNPASGLIFASVLTAGEATEVEARNGIAYVGGDGGVQIIDAISNPLAPEILSTIPGAADDIALSGNTLFVLRVDARTVRAFDVTDPAMPVMIDQISVDSFSIVEAFPEKIAATGDALYVAYSIFPDKFGFTGGHTVVAHDASDPSNIIVKVGIVNEGFPGFTDDVLRVRDVVVEGDRLYVTNSGFVGPEIRSYDISSAFDPQPASTGSFPPALGSQSAGGIDVVGNTAYVSSRLSLTIFDVSADPFVVLGEADWSADDDTYGITVVNNEAFIANGTSGLQRVDVNSSKIPVVAEPIETLPAEARDVAIQDGLAYVADVSVGLQILDVSNAQSPSVVGNVPIDFDVVGVQVIGDLAFLVGVVELAVIDVGTPASPQVVGSLTAPSGFSDIDAGSNVIFAAANDSGLLIIDFTTPSFPSIVGSVNTPSRASRVTVSGDHAFVLAFNSNQVQIIDATDPTVPAGVGELTFSDPEAILASGNLFFVWEGGLQNRLQVLDIADPAAPILIGSLETPSLQDVRDLSLGTDGLLYATTGSLTGVIDVNNPMAPILAGSVSTPGLARGVASGDGVAYLAGNSAGLLVVDASACGSSSGADFNGDGFVDASDLATVVAAWGQSVSTADLDGDGTVGASDLAVLIAAWGVVD